MEIKIHLEQAQSKNQLNQIIRQTISRSYPFPVEIKNKNFSKLPNGYANNKIFQRYSHTQYLLAASTTINLGLILSYFQLSIQSSSYTEFILYLGYIFHFFCIFILFINFKTFNQFKKQQNNLYELKKPSEFVFYLLLLLVRPLPFLDSFQFSFRNQFSVEYHKINHILCLLSLFQLFLIIPSLFISSKYQNMRSQRISNMYGFKASYIYALKCWFKQNSTLAVSMGFVGWFLACTQGIRISQFRYNPLLKSFQNSMWLTFISMSSVGFGDLYPKTTVGYWVSLITLYSGVIFMSIALMVLQNTFDMSSRQRRTLRILSSLQLKSQLKLVAASYLRESIWRVWQNKKYRKTSIVFYPSLTQRNLKQQFKELKRLTQSSNFDCNLRDQFSHNFAKMYGYMQNLKQNQDRMINFLQNKR